MNQSSAFGVEAPIALTLFQMNSTQPQVDPIEGHEVQVSFENLQTNWGDLNFVRALCNGFKISVWRDTSYLNERFGAVCHSPQGVPKLGIAQAVGRVAANEAGK